MGRKRITAIHVHKTFDVQRRWRVNGLPEKIIYALEKGYTGFEYKLTSSDKKIVRAASNDLWKHGTAIETGGLYSC